MPTLSTGAATTPANPIQEFQNLKNSQDLKGFIEKSNEIASLVLQEIRKQEEQRKKEKEEQNPESEVDATKHLPLSYKWARWRANTFNSPEILENYLIKKFRQLHWISSRDIKLEEEARHPYSWKLKENNTKKRKMLKFFQDILEYLHLQTKKKTREEIVQKSVNRTLNAFQYIRKHPIRAFFYRFTFKSGRDKYADKIARLLTVHFWTIGTENVIDELIKTLNTSIVSNERDKLNDFLNLLCYYYVCSITSAIQNFKRACANLEPNARANYEKQLNQFINPLAKNIRKFAELNGFTNPFSKLQIANTSTNNDENSEKVNSSPVIGFRVSIGKNKASRFIPLPQANELALVKGMNINSLGIKSKDDTEILTLTPENDFFTYEQKQKKDRRFWIKKASTFLAVFMALSCGALSWHFIIVYNASLWLLAVIAGVSGYGLNHVLFKRSLVGMFSYFFGKDNKITWQKLFCLFPAVGTGITFGLLYASSLQSLLLKFAFLTVAGALNPIGSVICFSVAIIAAIAIVSLMWKSFRELIDQQVHKKIISFFKELFTRKEKLNEEGQIIKEKNWQFYVTIVVKLFFISLGLAFAIVATIFNALGMHQTGLPIAQSFFDRFGQIGDQAAKGLCIICVFVFSGFTRLIFNSKNTVTFADYFSDGVIGFFAKIGKTIKDAFFPPKEQAIELKTVKSQKETSQSNIYRNLAVVSRDALVIVTCGALGTNAFSTGEVAGAAVTPHTGEVWTILPESKVDANNALDFIIKDGSLASAAAVSGAVNTNNTKQDMEQRQDYSIKALETIMTESENVPQHSSPKRASGDKQEANPPSSIDNNSGSGLASSSSSSLPVGEEIASTPVSQTTTAISNFFTPPNLNEKYSNITNNDTGNNHYSFIFQATTIPPDSSSHVAVAS